MAMFGDLSGRGGGAWYDPGQMAIDPNDPKAAKPGFSTDPMTYSQAMPVMTPGNGMSFGDANAPWNVAQQDPNALPPDPNTPPVVGSQTPGDLFASLMAKLKGMMPDPANPGGGFGQTAQVQGQVPGSISGGAPQQFGQNSNSAFSQQFGYDPTALPANFFDPQPGTGAPAPGILNQSSPAATLSALRSTARAA